ncbi:MULTISPECIES: nucleotidyltransferase domain-containing protein [unclassified Micromonospora]|uniref:nucleotidyltransferase domain-containing protein n=1 Tax=unclassified Micromonospora TaxID=2617518 RepID=UPI001C22749A|nr:MULTISPECIES: nucleotidyltransferase domain-containing protein [unclassified Micromonospora]MBU8861092.1 nucleotidyltransferase domain-containing protein [Micromonospora sp. WMMB482]MDM4780639.1 nucleotidyltransferase domain-containing protein [Micromonospora sp. b486]
MRDDIRDYLAEVVRRSRDVLGDDLVGAYAAGSVGLGAYQPGRSDVDVALLVAGPLPEADRRLLVDRLRHESLPCPARGLELMVYRRDVAASGTPEPGFEVELNTGATMPFRATYDPADRPAADGRFWYALDRSILRQSGLALLGPPAAGVFADPAPENLRALLADALRWWLALPTPPGDEPAPGAEDAVLGACRALVRSRDGVWLGKVDAGLRVAADDPDAALIRASIEARRGGTPPSGPAARAFQRRVLDRITAG